MPRDLSIVQFPPDVRVGTSHTYARYVLVSDSRDELEEGHPLLKERLWELAEDSIKTRGLVAKGFWMVGVDPTIDDPEWAEHVAPGTAAKVSDVLRAHPDYHWRVAVLVDSEDLQAERL